MENQDSTSIAESPSRPTSPSPSDIRTQTFNARWTNCGLSELHRERYAAVADPGTPTGAVQKQIADMPPGAIVALLGARGTGKTQIAHNLLGVAIAKYLHEWSTWKGQPRYTSAAKIFRAMRDAQKRQRGDEGDNESQTIARFVEPKLLVIDEAHERGETDFENRTFTEIIDDRYANNRTTILISNLSKAEFSKSIGPSIVSRIHEAGSTIECNWPSFRTPGAAK